MADQSAQPEGGQGADHQEGLQIIGNRRGKAQQRVTDDVEDQNFAPPIVVGKTAKQEGAQRPDRQRHRHGQRHRGDADAKLGSHIGQHKDQREEIQGVEGPG